MNWRECANEEQVTGFVERAKKALVGLTPENAAVHNVIHELVDLAERGLAEDDIGLKLDFVEGCEALGELKVDEPMVRSGIQAEAADLMSQGEVCRELCESVFWSTENLPMGCGVDINKAEAALGDDEEAITWLYEWANKYNGLIDDVRREGECFSKFLAERADQS